MLTMSRLYVIQKRDNTRCLEEKSLAKVSGRAALTARKILPANREIDIGELSALRDALKCINLIKIFVI